MPAVVKDIAIWLVEHRDVGEDDPLGEVVAEWKGLFGSWGCSAEAVDTDDLDARQLWADDVSGAFASRSRYFTSNMDVFSPVEG